MSLAFRKLHTYARLALMVAVAVVVALVLFKNRNHQATVWFFHKYEDINVVWLLVITGAGSVVAAWLTRGVFQVIKEVKRMRIEEESKRILRDQATRAQQLLEQERRIDAKLKASLESKGEDSA
ncbi:MAG: hypothetical protein JSU68_12930 [Phycisphaerales bacterium]|nr:MAG: hypothetical protein JSU68_12930 [Phycisphaerales bacterium]